MNRHADAVDVDRGSSMAAYSAAAAVGVAVLNVAPLVVGAYVDRLGFSAETAGYVFAGEMSGFTVGAVLILAAMRHIDWRRLVLASIALMLAGNLASAMVTTAQGLLAIRFVTGIGAGALMSMTVLVMGMTRQPERAYGYWDAAQLGLGAVHSLVLPRLLPQIGLGGFFTYVAFLAATLALTLRAWPQHGDYARHGAAGRMHWRDAGVLGLAAILIYQSGFWGVFTYLERIGMDAGIGAVAIGNALFLGQVGGLAGALLAVVLGTRAGRFAPLAVSLALIAAACGWLGLSVTLFSFTVVSVLLNFGFYWSQPYSTAAVARADTSGYLTAAVSVVLPLTAAAGPALAAALIASGSYRGLLGLGVLAMPAAALLLWPLFRTGRTSARAS